MNGRPPYASYLPAVYLSEPGGLLDRLIQMFETLMAGGEQGPVRALESWIVLENLAAAVLTGLQASTLPIRYDETRQRLVYEGEMSLADRAALDAVVAGATLVPAEETRHLEAIAELQARSQGRREPVLGLERLLDTVARYSDPITAPELVADPATGDTGYFDDDFVPYLAGWVALTLRQRWPDVKRRRLIQAIVPLYKKRGTLSGIREVLELFVESPVKISEDLGMVIAVRSTVAGDATVGGTPHFFRVDIPFGYREPGTPPARLDPQVLNSLVGFTSDVVEQEKPAHTDYVARIDFPGFIIGTYSTVEYDTLIGSTQPTLVRGSDSA